MPEPRISDASSREPPVPAEKQLPQKAIDMALLFGDASSIISVEIAIEEQAAAKPYVASRTVIRIKLNIEYVPIKNSVRLTSAKKKWMNSYMRLMPILSMIFPAVRKPSRVPTSASEEMMMMMLSATSRYFLM